VNEQNDIDEIVDIFKALADTTRLRLLALLIEQPRTGKALSELLDVGPPTISHHVAKLERAGLVRSRREGQSHIYTFDPAAMRRLSGSPASPETAIESGEVVDKAETERRKVLRDFFDGDSLKQIPAQRRKRVVVLQHLVVRFDPHREYPEREVNDMLRVAHEDFATLRRELVDYGFMTRAGGIYRVARDLPERSRQVGQEITGDEHEWLRNLLSVGMKTS
jgi:predicted transcriptional regulator